MLHRLFECRGRLLNGELGADNAAAFLSGLLIASDVGGALQLFADCPAKTHVASDRGAATDAAVRHRAPAPVMRCTAVGRRCRLARRSEPRSPTHRVAGGNECSLNRSRRARCAGRDPCAAWCRKRSRRGQGAVRGRLSRSSKCRSIRRIPSPALPHWPAALPSDCLVGAGTVLDRPARFAALMPRAGG